jgi:hypothetical protein
MKTAVFANDHAQYLLKNSILSVQQAMHTLPLAAVIKALNAQRIRYVLVGAHGHAGWRKESRATEDVDVVAMAKHQKKAVRSLLEAFPHLQVDDQEVVTRLRDPKSQMVVIDVMKTNQPLYQAAFKNCTQIEIEKQVCSIPTLEMALAMKFAAMISLVRADYKKYRDASDFIRMVQVNQTIDLAKLAELGELVYPGGGAEVTEKIRQVRAGEKIRL